jgi:predicted Zn-dependent peptidase
VIVRSASLPNGLRIVTDTFRSIQSAAINVMVEVGTRHEPDHLGGLAHFLEHMAFKGTERRTAQQIAEAVESRGGSLNAGTAAEWTSYSCRVLKEDIELAIDILSDIVCHSTLPPDEFERERGVILSELGDAEDNHEDRLYEKLYATVLPGTIGKPGLGTPETVKSLTVDDLRVFMDEHYSGSKIIVSASGNLNHDDFVAAVEKRFSHLPKGHRRTIVSPVYVSDEYHEQRDIEQIHLLMALPGCHLSDPLIYAASHLAMAFGGAWSSRLFQELREKRGLCYHVTATHTPYTDTGIIGIGLYCAPECMDEALPVLMGELNALSAGLLDHELETAKQIEKANLLMSLESPSQRLNLITSELRNQGAVFDIDIELAKISNVTHEDIKQIVDQMMANPPTLAVMGNGKLPTLDQINKLLRR